MSTKNILTNSPQEGNNTPSDSYIPTITDRQAIVLGRLACSAVLHGEPPIETFVADDLRLAIDRLGQMLAEIEAGHDVDDSETDLLVRWINHLKSELSQARARLAVLRATPARGGEL